MTRIAVPYLSTDAAAPRSPPQSWNLMNSLATGWCMQNTDADNKLLPTIWHNGLCSNQQALASIGLPQHEPVQQNLETGKASALDCNQLGESLPGTWELEFAYIDDIFCLPERNSGETDNVPIKIKAEPFTCMACFTSMKQPIAQLLITMFLHWPLLLV